MNKRQGIWIDIQLINNNELDWLNKILLSEIISLSKLKNGCTASNEKLADFLGLKRQSIHRRIKFLVDNKYIFTKNIFSGGKCVGRIIFPTGKLMTAQASTMTAHADTMTAQAVINDSTRLHSMTAQSDPINSFTNSDKNSTNSVINTGKTLSELEEKYFKKFNV